MSNLVGAFLTCLWGFSALIKILNSTLWLKVSHRMRFIITNGLFILGYCIISYTYLIDGSEVYGFWLALFGTLVMGIASTFGETVMLGKILMILF